MLATAQDTSAQNGATGSPFAGLPYEPLQTTADMERVRALLENASDSEASGRYRTGEELRRAARPAAQRDWFARPLPRYRSNIFLPLGAGAAEDTWPLKPPLVEPWLVPPDIRSVTQEENVQHLQLTQEARILGDDGSAEPVWRELLSLSEAAWGPQHPMTARDVHSLALFLDRLGRPSDAEALHRRALAIRETRLGVEHPATAQSLYALALNLDRQGRSSDAEVYLRRRLALVRTALPADHTLALSSQNDLANILFDQARFDEAEEIIVRVLDIRKSRVPEDPKLGEPLNTLAGIYMARGRYAEAEPLLRRSLELAQAGIFNGGYFMMPLATGDMGDTNVANRLENLAHALSAQERHAEAEPLLQRALIILESRTPPTDLRRANVLDSLGRNLNAQGRLAEALAFRIRGLEILDARGGLENPIAARAMMNLAGNLEDLGQSAAAEELQRKAIEILKKTLDPQHPNIGAGLMNLAGNLARQGRIADADVLYRQALSISTARLGPEHVQTAAAMNNLASNLERQNKLIDADVMFRKALAIVTARLGPSHPNVLSTSENLARLELKRRRPEASLAYARSALRGREQAASQTRTGDAVRSNNMYAVGYAANFLARAAWSQAQLRPSEAQALRAEAFAAAQSIRASASADALAQGVARLAAESDGAGKEVAAWRTARADIAALDFEIAEAAAKGAEADSTRARLALDRRSAVRDWEEAENALVTRFPRYFDLLKPSPISIADLQATRGDTARLLGADEALVLLGSGDADMPVGQRRGLIFVVTKESSAWAEIPLEPEALRGEIAALHAMLSARGAGATLARGKPAPTVRYDRARAFALYRQLFGAPDIAAALAGKTRWLIAPQGSLMSLPFAALPMEQPAGNDADPAALRATTWLGLERTLAILPSVSALRVQRLYPVARTQADRTPFFGLGDPAFRGVADGDDKRGGTLAAARTYFRGAVADRATFDRLPRLPNTDIEIRRLAENLGAPESAFILQLEASEAEVRRRNDDGRLARAEVVAFATHGLVAGEFQDSIAEPALALTPPAPGANTQVTADNDGLLTASEAATLTLSARFVILSACNTASGGNPDADSLSGLARAFFFAGAQSLLVSHYPVFDAAAMRLTTEATRRAQAGLRNPEAIRASMRALVDDPAADEGGMSFAHPTAWAPFAVIDAN